MTIMGDEGWKQLEAKAYAAEHQGADLAHLLEVKPVPADTVAQQLSFAIIRAAELQAKVNQMQALANEGLLWISMQETERAKQILARIILGDL